MHELRVKPGEFDALFDPDTDVSPAEREKTRKRLRLMCIRFPLLEQELDQKTIAANAAQEDAGKFREMKKNLKLAKS